MDPVAGNPPDPTKAAVLAVPGNPPPAGSWTRESNLPFQAIIDAIHGKIATSKVAPELNVNPGILGNFVSAYMAYHSCWYQAYSQNEYPNSTCKRAGHTHVDLDVLPADGRIAVDAQLDALIASL
jgi:hypothetical protein